MDELSDIQKAIMGFLTLVLGSLLVYFYFLPWHVEKMYVVDKRWRYTVEECEDYTTTSCDRVCTRNSNNTESCSTKCTTETHTRIIQSWNAEGDYKVEPYWPTGYVIRPQYYERKRTWFGVWFKKDDRVQTYGPWSYSDYARLKYENVYTVTVNIFGIATKVE